MTARPARRVVLALCQLGGLVAALGACVPRRRAAPDRNPASPFHPPDPMQSPTAVSTPDAPAAIGPYSQAVVSGDWVFCSGQIALHPKTGELTGTTAAEQAERLLENLVAVLAAAGARPADVVRCTVFLVDMGDFAAVNAVYARYFDGPVPPSRATVAVAALPKGARVEVDCIARLPHTPRG